jgi:hypothetical protein
MHEEEPDGDEEEAGAEEAQGGEEGTTDSKEVRRQLTKGQITCNSKATNWKDTRPSRLECEPNWCPEKTFSS